MEKIRERIGKAENNLTKVSTTVDVHGADILSLKKSSAAHDNDIVKLYEKSDNTKENIASIKQDIKESFTRIEKTLEKSLGVQTEALGNQQKAIIEIKGFINKAIGITVALVFIATMIAKFS